MSRPIVLASASPRRKELLAELVPEFEIVVAGVDEDSLTVADPWITAKTLAMEKARAVALLRPEALVIGADTVVALAHEGGWLQLAKPFDRADAMRMLGLLSGREHLVITGVAIVRPEIEQAFAETTRVVFRPLEEAEIDAYVQTGEPMDKAGAYAIQGGAAQFIQGIEGSKTNVIGLPLEALRRALFGDPVPSPPRGEG